MCCTVMWGLTSYVLHSYVGTNFICAAQLCGDKLAVCCTVMWGLTSYVLHSYVGTNFICAAQLCGD